MSIKILVVDDEERIRNLLGAYLKREGFEVLYAEDGVEALKLIHINTINLVILDVMMPKMDGWEALTRLREEYNMPVIMLTAKGEEDDKLQGFNLGVDDYETKPFSPKLLIAKIKAILKRIHGEEKDVEILSYNGLVINEKSHEIHIEGSRVGVSATEFSLLVYLSKNIGIVLSREKILDSVWGYDFEGDLRVVDTQVKRLREKLGEKAGLITTVRGVGYKFEVKNEN